MARGDSPPLTGRIHWCGRTPPTGSCCSTGADHTFLETTAFSAWMSSALLGDDLLQPTILILELLQSLHLARLHRAKRGLPAVVRLLRDPVRPTYVRHLPARLALFHDRQDLLVGELAPFHRS